MKLETDLGFTMAYYILIRICINLDCFILSCYVFLVFNACCKWIKTHATLSWIYHHLQSLNDHGIYTLQELNDLSLLVRPQFTAVSVRGPTQHFQDICNLLDSSSISFDVIGCSETWFTAQKDTNSFLIPSYPLISDSRTHLLGVALFFLNQTILFP